MMRHLAGEFARRGIACDLLVATDRGPPLDHPPEGVRILRFHKGNCRRAIPSLARYLRVDRPDTLMSTVLSANVAAIIASRSMRSRPRVVIREASRTDVQIGSNSRARRFLDFQLRKLTYPLADFVIAVSQDARANLIETKLARANRSCVIPNPLTRLVFPSRRRNLSAGPPSILACGRLEPEKDYPTLLRAMRIVLREMDARLTILGEGSLHTELKQLCTDLDMMEKVRFEGFVENTEPFLEQAAVFVHTSRFEGFPSAVLEAVASGCPVVVTDSPGGAREIVCGGTYGTLVPMGNPEEIANGILDVLHGRVAFPPSGEYARRFTIREIADEYLKTLFPTAASELRQ